MIAQSNLTGVAPDVSCAPARLATVSDRNDNSLSKHPPQKKQDKQFTQFQLQCKEQKRDENKLRAANHPETRTKKSNSPPPANRTSPQCTLPQLPPPQPSANCWPAQ